jgi:hypothetical protein
MHITVTLELNPESRRKARAHKDLRIIIETYRCPNAVFQHITSTLPAQYAGRNPIG